MKQVMVMMLAGLLVAGAAFAEEGHGHKAAAAEEAINPYPLQTCLVSGEKLGSMGEPQTLVFKQEIEFCCKGCVKDFKKDPLAYVAKLAAAAKEDGKASMDMPKDATHDEGKSRHEGHGHH